MIKQNVAALALMLAGLQLTACAPHQPEPQGLSMRNPAAVWCLQSGGKLSSVNTDAGVTGYCTLPSGERIEQWTLYHRERGNKAAQ